MSILQRLLGRKTETPSREILLECLWSFTTHGQEEISLPEVLDSILYLQRSVPLGYEFSKDVLYSSGLFADINQLEENAYIRRYEYTHDGLLPKGYVTLTMPGRGHAQKVARELNQATLSLISQAVETSIAQHKDYWRLYPRI